MKSVFFGGVRINSVVGDLGLLVLRVFAGVSLALAHGWGKVLPSDAFMGRVASLGFPAEAAYVTMLTEFVGGLMLAAGFATRPVALAIVGNFIVAGFIAHAADPYQRKELAFMFLTVAFMFLCMGAGRFSVDRWLKR